jgi:large subunit ribosomal protein L6
MSRIGNKHINLPSDVTFKIENGDCEVKGKLGTLFVTIPHKIHVNEKNNVIVLTRDDDEKQTKELHGTTRALLHDAILGVSNGFQKNLEISGIGYRARLEGKNLILKVGFSHEVTIAPLEGVTVKITDKDGTSLNISGIDKQKVGQVASMIRDVRRPEPYGGKGIKYKGEHIVHKEGKRATAATATAGAVKK